MTAPSPLWERVLQSFFSTSCVCDDGAHVCVAVRQFKPFGSFTREYHRRWIKLYNTVWAEKREADLAAREARRKRLNELAEQQLWVIAAEAERKEREQNEQ